MAPSFLSFFSLSLLLLLLTVPHCLVRAVTYPVSSASLGHMFEGIGGLSGGGATSRLLPDYQPKQRAELLDYLFKPGFGASLHILKVEIGGDAESTEGTEASHMHVADEENYQRGYEWWLMREAKARNPHIKLYGLAWGFPSWVAEGGSSPLTNSTAMYVTKWVQGAKREHGLDIDYVGVWNEHSYSRDYILSLRRHLDEANLTSTHIIVADGGWGICDDLVKDPTYAAAVYAVGAHYPNSQTTANCAALGKPLWASEDFSTLFTAGGCWSRLLNRNYAFSNLTSTISWNLVSAYYDELPWGGVGLAHAPEPWSGWYEIGSVFWVTAHHTQFTNYGWHYLAHGNGVGNLASGGTYVSLTDGMGNLTIIIEAMSANVSHCQYSSGPNTPVTTQDVTLQLGSGFEGVKSLNVFYSSMDPQTPTWFVYKGPLQVVNGAVTLTVQPNELYTLSTLNGTKSSFPSPPPAKTPFPLPYTDSFDSYRPHTFPHYFDDQSGSFEIATATNTSHGNVLRQMVPHVPVAWCGDAPLTFTVIGDHSWRAVRAEVDVLIEKNGTVFLAVAVSSGGCVGQGGSSGVALGLSVDGSWVVSNTTTLRSALASGKTPYMAGQWVRLGVELGEGGTAVYLDGKEVAMVTELTSARHNGWVTLGSSYDYVQYDNLRISQRDGQKEQDETKVRLEQAKVSSE